MGGTYLFSLKKGLPPSGESQGNLKIFQGQKVREFLGKFHRNILHFRKVREKSGNLVILDHIF